MGLSILFFLSSFSTTLSLSFNIISIFSIQFFFAVPRISQRDIYENDTEGEREKPTTKFVDLLRTFPFIYFKAIESTSIRVRFRNGKNEFINVR